MGQGYLPWFYLGSPTEQVSERGAVMRRSKWSGSNKFWSVVGEGKMLRLSIESDNIPSMIFWGPPGSGKTTLIRALLSQRIPLTFSISATSRPPRENEQNGKDYHFLSAADFKKKIKEPLHCQSINMTL